MEKCTFEKGHSGERAVLEKGSRLKRAQLCRALGASPGPEATLAACPFVTMHAATQKPAQKMANPIGKKFLPSC